MKTTDYLAQTSARWLRPLMLLALLSVQFSVFSEAQAQEAFYIYRNDGDFDGFFYDQVERMGYSKFDLDSVEHDVFVVQEVQTADSLYRIPLAAIDSIGFQQPEIIFNPKLKIMDDLGMNPYYNSRGISSKGDFFQFWDDMPKALIPQKGDVLVGLDETVYGESISGKVVDVTSDWEGVKVYVEPLSDLADVFVQFITVEQVGTDEQGNARRRLAGVNPDGTLRNAPRRADGNADVSLLNLSGTLQKEWKPNEKTSITLGLNLGGELKLSLVYNITWTRFFVKMVLSESFEVGASVKAAVETGGEESFPYGPGGDGEIKFPATLPLFGVKPLPKAFVRCKGELSATLNFPKFQWGSSQTVIFDNKAESFMTGYLTDKDCPTEDEDLFTGFSGGIAWNGFFQTGIKEEATINTNSWFKGIFYTSYGMEVYAGPKLEGEVSLSVDGLMDDGAYGLLKDSKIEYSVFAVDLENKARMQYLWHDPEERTFWSTSKKFGTSTWYLFPEFKKTDVDYNEKTGILTAAVHPRRQVFWRSWVGIGVFNKDEKRIAEQFNESESYHLFNSFNEYKTQFVSLPAGHYTVKPLLRTIGCVMPVSGAEEAVDILPELELKSDSVAFEGKGGYKTVEFTTNANNVVVRAWEIDTNGNTSKTEWLEAFAPTIDETEKRSFDISAKPNEDVFGRDGIIVVAAYEDDLWKRDTLKVYQPGTGEFTKATVSVGCNIVSNVKSKGKRYDSFTKEYDTWDYIKTDTTTLSEKFIMPDTDYHPRYIYQAENLKVDNSFSNVRNGNIITLHGKVHAYEPRVKDPESSINYSVYEGEEETTREVTITVDVTRQPARILSVEMLEDYDENFEEAHDGSYLFGTEKSKISSKLRIVVDASALSLVDDGNPWYSPSWGATASTVTFTGTSLKSVVEEYNGTYLNFLGAHLGESDRTSEDQESNTAWTSHYDPTLSDNTKIKIQLTGELGEQ